MLNVGAHPLEDVPLFCALPASGYHPKLTELLPCFVRYWHHSFLPVAIYLVVDEIIAMKTKCICLIEPQDATHVRVYLVKTSRILKQ